MTSRPFFDTNVLVYSLTTGDPRAAIANRAISGGGTISLQVLAEFVSVARRKLRLPWATVDAAVADLLTLCPDPLDVDMATWQTATRVAVRYGYTIYDALVIAGGLQAGCRLLLSEDMQHGQVIDGRLTIRNPFLPGTD